MESLIESGLVFGEKLEVKITSHSRMCINLKDEAEISGKYLSYLSFRFHVDVLNKNFTMSEMHGDTLFFLCEFPDGEHNNGINFGVSICPDSYELAFQDTGNGWDYSVVYGINYTLDQVYYRWKDHLTENSYIDYQPPNSKDYKIIKEFIRLVRSDIER
ncbi:hypothetical protein phiOC_p101 [Ochrobactrum phage vB_OspM_OC]|nr:hypothetical protein phiOC_p101 [Ochrobactrum phage vB_OspM_OC]